jgi:hypothetical protein
MAVRLSPEDFMVWQVGDLVLPPCVLYVLHIARENEIDSMRMPHAHVLPGLISEEQERCNNTNQRNAQDLSVVLYF